MIETIEYKGKSYPKLQTEGFAAQYAFPFAMKICKGQGYDIGCNRQEWCLPGAIGIDRNFRAPLNDAMNLPYDYVDYIFSSHCLEHLDSWKDALCYWTDKLILGGVLFLYLPHYSQEYWRPENNDKHKHIMIPDLIRDFLYELDYRNIFVSGVDLNHSFTVIGNKTHARKV